MGREQQNIIWKDWRTSFNERQLDEGAEYVRTGKAKKVQIDAHIVTCTVRDQHNVQAKLLYKGDRILGMECSCGKYEDNLLCSHLAALCIYLEQQGWTPEDNGAEESLPEEGASEKAKGHSADKKGKESGKVPTYEEVMQSIGSLNALKNSETKLREQQQAESGEAVYTPEEYHYFKADNFLKGLDVSQKAMKDAQQLLKTGKYEPIRVNVGFENRIGSERQIGEAFFSEARNEYFYAWRVHLVFDEKRIVHSDCSSCYDRGNSRSHLQHDLCRHQVAAILKLQEYLKAYPLGDATNAAGMRLLHQTETIGDAGGRLLEQGKNPALQMLHIEPVLEIEEDRKMNVSFRIGSDKLYKIKKISEIVHCIHKEEEYQFGTKTVMKLSERCLEEDSLPWLHLMEATLEEEEQIQRRIERRQGYYYGSGRDVTLGSDIELYGGKMDQFFELALGHTVETVVREGNSKEKRMLLFRDRDIRLQMEIHQEVDEKTGEFQGIVLTGDAPEVIFGRNSAYYFDETSFNRISAQRTKELRPLLKEEHGGYIRIGIGRRNLADFYHKLLPGLQQIAQVTEYDQDVIGRYVAPVPVFRFFMDLLEDDVLCQAMVYYGTASFSIADNLKPVSDDPAVSYRDKEKEEAALDLLMKYLPSYDDKLKVFFCQKDEMELFDLLDHGLQELMDVGEVRATDRFLRLKVRRRVNLQVGVGIESHLLDLNVQSDELSEEELLEVLFKYRHKKNYIRLKNGDFLKLGDDDNISMLAGILEQLHISPKEFVKGKMQLPAYRALYLDKMLEQAQDVYTNRDQRFKKLIKEFKTVEDADYEVPEELRGVMRKYQESGYRWMRTLDAYGFGGILADDMGLGKTLQVIALFLADLLESGRKNASEVEINEAGEIVQDPADQPRTSIVVAPASLVYNWKEEISRFAPQLTTALVTGTQRERAVVLQNWDQADVLVTSYDLLKRDIDQYEGKMFRYAVIDEAQNIKNHTTAAAKSVKLLQAKTHLALTGTPIENRLSELWSIFDFVMPGYLYAYEGFRSGFEQPIVKGQSPEIQTQLTRMVSPFILRRLKKDVLRDLPDKLEELRFARMEKKQQLLYDGQVVRMRNTVSTQSEEDLRRNHIQLLAELTKIRQICCDPSLCFDNYDGESAKKELCMELVHELIESDHRALIFSQFTSMLALLEAELLKENIAYYKITGETPKEKRLQMVKEFNEGNVPIFLISLKAGGTGLNLTGADVVIHYDPWWNLAAQNQATDRAHRIGQTSIVTVYKLIMKGTIEEKIVELQESKKKLADDILGGENISAASFNRDELLQLLQNSSI